MNAPRVSAPALSSVPVLETTRLTLRAPGPQDLDAYIAAHDDPRAQWMGGNQGRDAA